MTPHDHATADHAFVPRSRLATAALRRYTHGAAPPLVRGSMTPTPWLGLAAALRHAWSARGAPVASGEAAQVRGWERAAARRRRALVLLVLGAAALAAMVMLQLLPLQPPGVGRVAQVALFALLFAWVAAGFVTALMGYLALRRGDRHALSWQRVANDPIRPDARTALVMPICNEHVPTVFAGLAATAESLVAAGGARIVEIFVLSDTGDAATRAVEHQAWQALRERLAASGLRVHYRWRARRTHRKAGNVADFCRRWGRAFRYMVVLDADSVMSGEAVLGLVRLMEAHPRAGIVQSAPVACGLDTPHARAQQFATRVTGRLFSAGLQFWQLGESHYWGHNAIIRIAPFMQHCALAPLPGRGALAGSILSHDFVEAALMRRAGWQVWLAADLPGSYEQQPPHLLAELQRDRRWCQGNLMNARLIAEPGLHRVHRAMLGTGAIAYLSAPLWLAFVVLGVGLWLAGGHALPDPLTMLLGPRLLGALLVLQQRQGHLYGGALRLAGSALLEALLSALQAPVRMAAHTIFVAGALLGLPLQWKSPPREAEQLAWRDAARPLAPLSLLAALALAGALWLDAGIALWLAPVALPLVLAVPLAGWGSRPAAGRALKRAGLLLTPEETATPGVLRRAEALALPLRPGHALPDKVVALRAPRRPEFAVLASGALTLDPRERRLAPPR